MAKNKQSNSIVGAKMLNMGFINKYLINSGRRLGAYSLSVN